MLDRRNRAEVHYLSRDGGMVPCSRYGRNGQECATIAALVDAILEREGCDARSATSAKEIMGYVVNDSDDPAVTIIKDGPVHGINPYDWLDADVVEDALSLLSKLYDEDAEHDARHAIRMMCP